jgi:hypothetical protein
LPLNTNCKASQRSIRKRMFALEYIMLTAVTWTTSAARRSGSTPDLRTRYGNRLHLNCSSSTSTQCASQHLNESCHTLESSLPRPCPVRGIDVGLKPRNPCVPAVEWATGPIETLRVASLSSCRVDERQARRLLPVGLLPRPRRRYQLSQLQAKFHDVLYMPKARQSLGDADGRCARVHTSVTVQVSPVRRLVSCVRAVGLDCSLTSSAHGSNILTVARSCRKRCSRRAISSAPVSCPHCELSEQRLRSRQLRRQSRSPMKSIRHLPR